MAADEATPLLAQPVPHLVPYPEERSENGAGAATGGKTFELWHLAAFFGRNPTSNA